MMAVMIILNEICGIASCQAYEARLFVKSPRRVRGWSASPRSAVRHVFDDHYNAIPQDGDHHAGHTFDKYSDLLPASRKGIPPGTTRIPTEHAHVPFHGIRPRTGGIPLHIGRTRDVEKHVAHIHRHTVRTHSRRADTSLQTMTRIGSTIEPSACTGQRSLGTTGCNVP